MPNVRNREIVKRLTEKFKLMKGLILTEYHGLTVEELSELRLKLRSFNSEYAVVKNTLSEIALKEAGIEAGKNFCGPTALIIENGDIISPAKVVMNFARIHTKLKIRAGFLEGKFVDASVVEKLSMLPSREILMVKMLGSMNAPITSFVNVLVANIRDLVTVLDAIVKKQAA
ncbi:MAG: 50S ribosomal protein L10 [Endomicrobium sp.]|jgi:large subunit ribosomal protein L10|nr:50S ribosomal protein L10 [Endomicrobium sp.]